MKLTSYDAVLFDLDGVLTPTAELHREAWDQLFTSLFNKYGLQPPYSELDYYVHLDGRPRYEGVSALLASRKFEVPTGNPADPPTAITRCGLGNRKDQIFAAILATRGVRPYPAAVALVSLLNRARVRCAVVSSSRNATDVLAAAGLRDGFDVVVDGRTAEAQGLAGKPAPDTFQFAAKALGATPRRSVVVEDAISGVLAAHQGQFGLIVGVDGGAGAAALKAAGASIVIKDLAELLPGP